MNGCKYCYANQNPKKAFENFKLHDPDSPLLLGHIEATDTVTQGAQKTFLKESNRVVPRLYVIDAIIVGVYNDNCQ